MTAIDQTYIKNQLNKASQYFKQDNYNQADSLIKDTIEILQNQLAKSNPSTLTDNLKKGLAQCFVNRAVCLFNADQASQEQGLVQQCLQTALSLDYLNFWAYLNLASYHLVCFNYEVALDNLKCSLSCLYLLKAVLCKDLDNKSKEKDLGKAISLCNNNLQAELIRLLIYLRQNRWKNAHNQIEIVQQIIGENQHLHQLSQEIHSIQKNSSQEDTLRQFFQKAIALIIDVKRESSPLRLNANTEELHNLNIIKLINDKLYQFNEIINQVNELGGVFGLFQFRTICKKEAANKKSAIVSNLISQDNKYKIMISQTVKNRDNQKITKSLQPEAKFAEKGTQSRNLQSRSLFELTKSHNDYTLQNKEAEFSGNLLSDLQNTAKPLITVQQSPQSHLSAFNFESIVLPNMRKKQCQIRVIQSEIHPLDLQDYGNQQPHSSNHHFLENQQQDDLLLDSAFRMQPAYQPQISEIKPKKEEKAARLYPLNQQYKYLQIYLVDIDFKQPLPTALTDIYCELEATGKRFRSRKIDLRKVNERVVGEWNQSVGCIIVPEQAQNIQIKINRCENQRYFDVSLGEGQIEMTTIGVNKVPIYNEERLVGMATLRLNQHEQMLAASISSYKQSSLSSSKKSEGVKQELYGTIPNQFNLLAQ